MERDQSETGSQVEKVVDTDCELPIYDVWWRSYCISAWP